jgi:hypothetical protein
MDSHLSDDRLIDLYAAERCGASPSVEGHLESCGECRHRYAELVSFVAAASDDGVAAIDETLAVDFDVQHGAILRRIEALRGPARVLAFPASARRQVATAHRHVRRSVLTVAAAGIVIGVVTGRFVMTPRRVDVRHPAETRTAAVVPQQASAVPVAINEEAFLLEVESALGTPSVAELQALDALTPAAEAALDLR